jgi:hypothetical protein
MVSHICQIILQSFSLTPSSEVHIVLLQDINRYKIGMASSGIQVISDVMVNCQWVGKFLCTNIPITRNYIHLQLFLTLLRVYTIIILTRQYSILS